MQLQLLHAPTMEGWIMVFMYYVQNPFHNNNYIHIHYATLSKTEKKTK